VTPAARRQRLVANGLDDLPEPVERLAPSLGPPEIPLELFGGPRRESTMRRLQLIEVGPLRQVLSLERVADWGCGACRHCRLGWSQLCTRRLPGLRRHRAGAHADYMKAPARTLVPLPDELSFATGAAISRGTGTAYQALRRMKVSGRDTLAVFGQGPVGLSATQLGTAMGARVIALDVTPERRGLGADAALDPAADEPVAALKDLTRGQGVDLALDRSGAEAVRTVAVRATRTWGTVCFVGEGGSLTIDISRGTFPMCPLSFLGFTWLYRGIQARG
jgi:D-arabinose 1-dehydrogenase-like Zn-dependent alcohol dehydrogenase